MAEHNNNYNIYDLSVCTSPPLPVLSSHHRACMSQGQGLLYREPLMAISSAEGEIK